MDEKKKITQLPECTNIEDAYTIGVNSLNESVKIPIGNMFIHGYVTEYNVSKNNINSVAGDENYNTNVFSFQQAIALVPDNLHQVGMKVNFITSFKFKNADGTFSTLKREVCYQYIGESVSGWTDTSNWISLTPIILTESQYVGLVTKESNTLYYIEES